MEHFKIIKIIDKDIHTQEWYMRVPTSYTEDQIVQCFTDDITSEIKLQFEDYDREIVVEELTGDEKKYATC